MILHKERVAIKISRQLKAMQKHKSQNAEKRGGRTSAPRNKKKDEKMKLNADKDQE